MLNDFEASCAAKVHIIDNEGGFHSSIAAALESAGLQAVRHARVDEFLACDSADSPRCILLDMLLPAASTIERLASLARGRLRAPVIFVTDGRDIAASVRAMQAGAIDCLIKPTDPEKLCSSVRRAIAVDRQRCAEAERVRAVRLRYERLNDRERQVMSGVVQGRLNKQLSVDMYMSERTVKAYRAKIMAKLEIESMTDLVRIALLLGLPVIRRPARRAAASSVAEALLSG